MRIGLFTDTYLPDINGVVSSIETLRKSLVDLGHEVYVICTKPSLKLAVLEDHILRLPGIEVKQMYDYAITGPVHIHAKNLVKQMKLDIIHCHTEFGVGIFARTISNQLNIPLVATYHTFYEDYTHYINVLNLKSFEKVLKRFTINFSRFFSDTCQQLIVPTEKTKERLTDYGVKTKMTVIPTGLDFSTFDSLEKVDTGFDKDDFVISFIGRIAEEKSVDVLIKAIAILREQNQKVSLMIVGDGPDVKKLEELSRELNVENYVNFMGRVNHDEIVKYYNSSDCFVSASLSETQGMTFIEAMACNKIVLACDKVALDGVLVDKENGYYFDDENSLAEKVIEVMSLTESQKQEMQNYGKQIALEYSSESFGRKVLRVYMDAIENYGEVSFISKVRIKDNTAILTVEDQQSETTYKMRLDDYLEKQYHKGQGLNEDELNELASLHLVNYAFVKCLRKLEASDKSEKEIRDFLKKFKEMDDASRESIIESLKSYGYLNDESVAESQVLIDQSKLLGVKKTIYNLVKRGVSEDIIDAVVAGTDISEEYQRGLMKARMYLKNTNGKSYKESLKAVSQKLYSDGYENVDDIIKNVDYSFDNEKEMSNLRRQALSITRRYKGKYSGRDFYNNCFRYLYNKGFEADSIQQVLKELEEENED